MLARANRVVLGEDFRSTVRRGRRVTTPSAIVYRLPTRDSAPFRVGVIVARSVGNSVVRNRVRRRFRALGRGFVDAGYAGEDVVIRALPASADRDWDSLSADMHGAFDPAPARR